MDLTFCKICGAQQGEGVIGCVPACPNSSAKAGHLPVGDRDVPTTTTITLNRKQRRQALARSKIRLRKEKHQ